MKFHGVITVSTNSIKVIQSKAFEKKVKKLHIQEKQALDNAVREIIKDPYAGQQKKGELSNTFVYKYKVNTAQYLLAYEFDPKNRYLLLLGSHENFYKDLKKYKKS